MRNINLRYVDEEYDDNGIIEKVTTHYPDDFNFGYDIIDDIGTNDPDRRALVWCDDQGDEKVFTFADIMRLSNKMANYLMSEGVRKGDFVMVVLKHNWQFWYVSVALCKIGAIMVPATYMLTKHDVEYRIKAAGIKAAICIANGGITQAFDEAEDVPSLKLKFTVNGKRDGWIDLDEGTEASSDVLPRQETHAHEVFMMYFTSGTSGHPKMAMHDHTYPIGSIVNAKHWHCVDSDNGLHFSIADTGWAKTAWGKIFGQWVMESAVFVYEYEKFVPADVLDLIGKYHITTLCCPPTMFRFFLDAGIEGHDLSSLQNCCIAGEALSPDTYNTWYEKTGLRLMEGYGQTETSAIAGTFRGMVPKPGSMGVPSPQYTVDIIDENGNSCPAGVDGEVVIDITNRPPGITVGYYRDEARNEEMRRTGLHRTGDIAWKDEDGYMWYVGRNDDIIKSSGYRISPFEIESVLMTHPAVLECAVTGVPDPIRGQLIKATIVLRSAYKPSDALKKELQDYVKKETAPYKYPRSVAFVDQLPKTTSGKVMRVTIRKKDSEMTETR
jgi:acetyl-CoA synthetase